MKWCVVWCGYQNGYQRTRVQHGLGSVFNFWYPFYVLHSPQGEGGGQLYNYSMSTKFFTLIMNKYSCELRKLLGKWLQPRFGLPNHLIWSVSPTFYEDWGSDHSNPSTLKLLIMNNISMPNLGCFILTPKVIVIWVINTSKLVFATPIDSKRVVLPQKALLDNDLYSTQRYTPM